MRHRQLTPKAKRRRLAVAVIELGIVTGVIIGTMIARLYDCTVDELLQGNPTFGKASEVRELRARRHESDLV